MYSHNLSAGQNFYNAEKFSDPNLNFVGPGAYVVELLSRILKSLIKVGYPSRFKSFLSDFLHVDSPCSCDHFEMRLTYVGLLVPKL